MLDLEHHTQWQKGLEKINVYALNININLKPKIFPVGILIEVIQKSIPPSNHTFIIMLLGRI